MALRRPSRVVFPENIHQIAADIRRQALQHPERDPVVPGAPRRRKRAAAKATARKRKSARKATTGKRSTSKTTRGRRK